MAKYTETQTRKIISSYGGVESIIETPKGALKIERFDLWPFFKAIDDGKIETSDFILEDNRLLKRLQTLTGFPKLKEFLRVPPNYKNPNNKSIPLNKDEVVSSSYFPTWFYCNNCEGFKRIGTWWDEWKKVVEKHGGQAKKSDFVPPQCPTCYGKSRSGNKADGKRRRFYYDLEQVRFVMTAPTGELKDIPWERWNKVTKNSTDDNSSGIQFDWENFCCESQDLKYYKSRKFSDLAGIRIECKSCKAKNTLSGFFGMRIRVYNREDVFFKPVLRTSNSCYYPITVSSIYLPVDREIDIEDQKAIEEWIEDGDKVDFIYKALRKKYSIEKIENFIKGEIKGQFEPENEYRLKEYNFITEPNRTKHPNQDSTDNGLVFDRVEIKNLQKLGIENLTAIKRLKITTVQTAYTRQEPLDNDQFLSGESIENSIEAKYTSEWGNKTRYLPAIESFGEGVFIALDDEKINNWLSESFKNERFTIRVNTLYENSKNNDLASVQNKFKTEYHLAKFVLIHSLSHILIKELEFLCGYPATSLSERLFVDENNMIGVLLYTIAGTEGSYGGLVSQASENNFNRLLSSALFRASDCASDPICYNTEDGQGVGGLNMGACYSCCLIPENACEEFNSYLDRAILVDNEFGFYNGK